jgi:hypothetical protein
MVEVVGPDGRHPVTLLNQCYHEMDCHQHVKVERVIEDLGTGCGGHSMWACLLLGLLSNGNVGGI